MFARRRKDSLLAPPPAPALHSRITHWQGQLCLKFARCVQLALAHRPTRTDVAVRNKAMRAAYRRGIDRNAIKEAIGLSEQQIRTVLAERRSTGDKPPVPPLADADEAGGDPA
jgi:hypothetical protein